MSGDKAPGSSRRDTLTAKRNRARTIASRLREAYPRARCSLEHRDPVHLLVATILAAQCTDARVNMVTPHLFRMFPDVYALASAPLPALEDAIHSCGFYHAKSRNIKLACQVIAERYDGRPPDTMEELLKLPGVGRKTANVLLGECFGVPSIIVDTHCGRLARRMGFTESEDPTQVERDLMGLWDRENWTINSHCMLFHGREVCKARGPACQDCSVAMHCPRNGLA